VADAVESAGQDMHQEADELMCRQPHDLHKIAALDPIVFPSKRHGVGIGADEALVRDRDTVRVTTEVAVRCSLRDFRVCAKSQADNRSA